MGRDLCDVSFRMAGRRKICVIFCEVAGPLFAHTDRVSTFTSYIFVGSLIYFKPPLGRVLTQRAHHEQKSRLLLDITFGGSGSNLQFEMAEYFRRDLPRVKVCAKLKYTRGQHLVPKVW